MPEPLISVVMSVFNGERFLPEAIESILNQSFSLFEFIIINDGSTDGSASLIDSYQVQDPKVRVYHQENRGLVESLNRGCALARGKYIARMDADDVAMADRLMRQLTFLEENPDVGVLGGTVELIDAAGKSMGFGRNPLTDRDIRAVFPLCPFFHSTVMMRTEVFFSTGGYRKIVVDSEDHDLWLRMAEKVKLANVSETVLKYRVHPDQVSVKNCRSQVVSALAAQAAFLARQRGEPDPLYGIQRITPTLLVQIGVSEVEQATEFVHRYLARATVYVHADESLARKVLKEAGEILQDTQHTAHSRVIADLHLLRAEIYSYHGRYLHAVSALARALWTRPIVAARPIKPLFCMFRSRPA